MSTTTSRADAQPTLFSIEAAAPQPQEPSRELIRQLGRLLAALRRSEDPLEQARTSRELCEVADRFTADRIREANRSGHTWRAIGTRLGAPFQTLHRRYGTGADDSEA